MGFQKYILLALITLSLTIGESCGVNFQLRFLDSTAVAQTTNDRKEEADRLLERGLKQFNTSQFQQALQSWEQSLAIYNNVYKDKLGKAQAMRQAMLKMLKDEDGDPDPKNWAAFTVIGKTR